QPSPNLQSGKMETGGSPSVLWMCETNEHRTSNVQHRMLNGERTYALEERLLPSLSKRLRRNRNSR
ncbi:MAG: hypothetical protein U9Q89_05835, partial [Thermodesulfobacteriota bacterium]|nr:hypothetical protein [Thermodesulfobacteriota bacterium]